MTALACISLIGFSGTGKSTVARLLASKLGWRLLDLDAAVEERTGRPIPEIFASDGEAAFRRLEEEMLRSALSTESAPATVVAFGGGATLSEAVRRLIAERGLVFCLQATPETIEARLAGSAGPVSDRPLLAGSDRLAQIERLKASRSSLYALADFTIHVDALSPEETADEIVRLLHSKYAERTFKRAGRVESLSRAPSDLPAVMDAPGVAAIVRTPSGSYPAFVDWGALERLGEHVKRSTGASRAFVISDTSVLKLWGETALSSLRTAGIQAESFALPPGDASKSLAGAGQAYDWLAAMRAERKDAVVALGGGMTGDFAGFVAATYLRGMPLIQAPTSLLAMVDASIGGKTAVNHAGAKNLVGSFYQPRAVVADPATLKTLPRRELIEGMGEVIKHALIRDEQLLGLLETRLDDLLSLADIDLTTDILRRNIRIKAEVVGADEHETGLREILNYGHTLGHAFEAAGGYESLLHGEAVAVGMMAAAEIGRRVGITPADVVERQRALIERTGLPLRPPAGIDRERVLEALTLDKKVASGKQRWVLLEGVGRPVLRSDIPAEVVTGVLHDLLG
jgi:shikimate kinase / 3-dehydroquinate synthase